MAYSRYWIQDTNFRGCDYTYYEGEHVNLTELEEDHPDHGYLGRNSTPFYPECVFDVANVCHVTEKSGLHGIFRDHGFRGNDSFLWWSLSVTDEDIVNAENKFLTSQNFSWQNPNQKPFLKKFTTSPAFQSESRYGNFRFTFKLKELLKIYSKEYCERTAPILRVLDTKLYKQEILYSILVHPRYMTHYRKYPRLPIDDNSLCGYSQGSVSWRCQSPSNNYKYRLKVDDEEGEVSARPLRRTEYFVWDKVAVAFHMKRDWILPVGHAQLFDNLSVCKTASKNLLKEPKMSVHEAKKEVENLRKMYL
ncbi:hypothetical protein PHYPO_G00126620 [Pangasianodon hypophthalmus]|uniref:Uncharacterized protein n=1 Tax=Pangasianodon hypophthalmus TaxID=310915 RepID=A0A5N5KSC1_PANHP|nr:uncharacterized protein LOC113532636 [Pangasianodon hypophthalmus]KAB5533006.1 hypothetical protein PHYPO_G00126620 [Pangasianodon hypophthalmus]